MSDWLHQAAAQATPEARAVPQVARIEPSPAGHPMAWADAAACTGMDPALFYIERGEAIAEEVVATCRTCPVLAECRSWALAHEKYGYWAGLSERGRRRLRRTLGIRLIDDTDDQPAHGGDAA